MHWLLLVFAAIALVLAARTASSALMVVWFLLMLASVGAWVWLRYKLLFPPRSGQLAMTPLDAGELARLRKQTQVNREAEAAEREAAEQEALHPIHPVSPELHWSPAAAAPAPVDRPITGRAVFVLPDDAPPPVGARSDRSS